MCRTDLNETAVTKQYFPVVQFVDEILSATILMKAIEQ